LVVFPSEIEGELILRDYTGKSVLTKVVKQENQLDISDLPNGVYMIEIKTSGGIWIEKVLKIL